jgi:hypothetical protein
MKTTTTTIRLTDAAMRNIAEIGNDIDVANDIAAIRSGRMSEDELLDLCLDGADDDRVQGWREYVDAVIDAAHDADAMNVTTKAATIDDGITVTIEGDRICLTIAGRLATRDDDGTVDWPVVPDAAVEDALGLPRGSIVHASWGVGSHYPGEPDLHQVARIRPR